MPPLTPLLSLIDAHTGGEPARLVLSGLPPIPGATMAAKKACWSRCGLWRSWRSLGW